MKAEKLNWFIFGCTVSRRVLNTTKLKLDVPCHLPDVYTKFRISKHADKIPEKLCGGQEPCWSPTSVSFWQPEVHNVSNTTTTNRDWEMHYMSVYQISRIYIVHEAMNAEKCIWPVMQVKVTQLRWNSISTISQIGIWKCLTSQFISFLPGDRFGLRVLSLAVSVCVSVCVCACPCVNPEPVSSITH